MEEALSDSLDALRLEMEAWSDTSPATMILESFYKILSAFNSSSDSSSRFIISSEVPTMSWYCLNMFPLRCVFTIFLLIFLRSFTSC